MSRGLRTYRSLYYVATGTDLPEVTDTIAPITCPFTGEELAAVAALSPDVSIIHAQQADRRGNVAMWGITGIQKEAVLSSRRAIVTVEEVVEAFEPHYSQVVLPSAAVDAIAVVPGGAYPPTPTAITPATIPSMRHGIRSVATASASARMERHVLGTEDFAEHLESIQEAEVSW